MATSSAVSHTPLALRVGVGIAGTVDAGKLVITFLPNESQAITVSAKGVALKYADSTSIVHAVNSTGQLVSSVRLNPSLDNPLYEDDGLAVCLQSTQTIAIKKVGKCRTFSAVLDPRTDGCIIMREGSNGIYSVLKFVPTTPGSALSLKATDGGLVAQLDIDPNGSLVQTAAGLAVRLDPNPANIVRFGPNGVYAIPTPFVVAGERWDPSEGDSTVIGGQTWKAATKVLDLMNTSTSVASADITFRSPSITFSLAADTMFTLEATYRITGSGGLVDQTITKMYAGFDNRAPNDKAIGGVTAGDTETVYVGNIPPGATIQATMSHRLVWAGAGGPASIRPGTLGSIKGMMRSGG